MASASFTAVLATAGYTLALDSSVPDQSVMLGEFLFSEWEVPERIQWGGAQVLKVHKMIGGERTVDAMGPDNQDITWSAIFLGEDASVRADQLDQMRQDGQPRSFIFAGRFYTVVISNFVADQRMLSYVPFTISLSVVRDQSQGAILYLPNPLADVLADAIAVNSLLGAPPLELVAAAAVMAGVPPQLQALPAIVIGSAATEAAIGGMTAGAFFLGNVQADAATRMDALNAQAAQSGTLAGGSTVIDATANMQEAQNVAELQALGITGMSFTGRAINTANSV